MRGFDFDDVTTAGIMPGPEDVIITGRSYEEATETFAHARRLGFYGAIYFNPVPREKKSNYNSGFWKATMINKLRITEFFEDHPEQLSVIKNNVLPTVKLNHVVGGKII